MLAFGRVAGNYSVDLTIAVGVLVAYEIDSESGGVEQDALGGDAARNGYRSDWELSQSRADNTAGAEFGYGAAAVMERASELTPAHSILSKCSPLGMSPGTTALI